MITLADPQGHPLQDVLTEDSRIKAAAFIAETFSMDPIVVLASDRDTWRIRLAAANARAKVNSPDQEVSHA